MKQIKRNKLALAKQTVRTLTEVADVRLGDVGGGSLIHTKVLSQCTQQTTGVTCPG